MIVVAIHSCDGSLKSSIIKKWTGSKFTHAGILLSDGNELSSWSECGVDIRSHELSEENKYYKIDGVSEEQIKDFIVEKLPSGYNNLGVVTAQALNIDIDNKDRYFCSELIYIALVQLGVIEFYINPDKVTPGLLNDILSKSANISK